MLLIFPSLPRTSPAGQAPRPLPHFGGQTGPPTGGGHLYAAESEKPGDLFPSGASELASASAICFFCNHCSRRISGNRMCGQQKSAVSESLPRRRFSVVDQSKYCRRRLCYVHAAARRNSGGVDTQKVRGRPRLRYEPAGGHVWQQVNGAEVLTKITDVKPGDRIVIRAARTLI